jgi:hypothetical protein
VEIQNSKIKSSLEKGLRKKCSPQIQRKYKKMESFEPKKKYAKRQRILNQVIMPND